MERDGDLSQDDRRLYEEEIQGMTDDHVAQIDEFLTNKEAEIMQV